MKTTLLSLAVAGFALGALVPSGAADAAKKSIKAKYYCSKGQYSLRGRGNKATWTAGRAKPLKCTS